MVIRASTDEEIRPLIDLCRAGRLFEVQDWISAGRPVNPPPAPPKGRANRTPLYYAIEHGFHSLVAVLLNAGAEVEYGDRYSALWHAVERKRLDFVDLLQKHGADLRSVSMWDVFETYDADIMEYFIEHDADPEKGNPLAAAFCHRIQPALRIFKKYNDRFPSFQEQVNIALRHHCREGNEKWIALMLWAGADPWKKGAVDADGEPDPEMDETALELAARHDHLEVFKMRKVHLDPKHEHAFDLVNQACYAKSAELLIELMRLGFPVNDQPNGGSSLVRHLLSWMAFSGMFTIPECNKNIDTEAARERMKMLHLVVKQGARWIPEDKGEINSVRRDLLKLIPDYTTEFIWVMATYGGCSRALGETLLKTSAIRTHVRDHLPRIEQLMAKLPNL